MSAPRRDARRRAASGGARGGAGGEAGRQAPSRTPFMLRWVVAVAASLVVGSAVEYAVGSQQLEHRILQESTDGYRADLASLEAVLGSGVDGAPRAAAVERALGAVQLTHGTQFVGLFDAAGYPVVVVGGEPERLEADVVERVLSSGEPLVETESDEGEDEDGRYEFLFPVTSDDGLMVVEIDQRQALVADMLADLRLRKLLGLLLGLAVAVPVSYVLGGRTLHRQQRRAERAADTDALTGLAGRRPFRPTLDAALAHPAGAVLALLDIDDFKQVNDRLGHSYGDRVLCALAESFAGLRSADVAFRLGGDEFAVVLTGVTEAQAAECLDRVRRSFAERAPGVTFSAGVAAPPADHRADQQELWERADAALYEAKARGRRRTVAFGDMTTAATVSPAKIEAVTRLLADAAGLTVAFQPIWDLREGRVIGHEALLRLPSGSPLDGPQEAFDLAQRCGVASRLDEVARRTTLAAVRGRRWEGLLFVNVHPESLAALDVEALLGEVADAGLSPSDVILEVTEHDGLDRPEAVRALQQAHERGFRLALDDMGRGNAGLRALTYVRFDVVKLDRAVVARLGEDPGSDATIAAATTFVRQTGGWVIAEGIEDARTLHAVLGLDGHPAAAVRVAGQGYLLGRPVATPVGIGARLDVLDSSALPVAAAV